jgi:hypothetical protein
MLFVCFQFSVAEVVERCADHSFHVVAVHLHGGDRYSGGLGDDGFVVLVLETLQFHLFFAFPPHVFLVLVDDDHFHVGSGFCARLCLFHSSSLSLHPHPFLPFCGDHYHLHLLIPEMILGVLHVEIGLHLASLPPKRCLVTFELLKHGVVRVNLLLLPEGEIQRALCYLVISRGYEHHPSFLDLEED